jgi:citrate synthase
MTIERNRETRRMKIGKATIPRTAISTTDEDTIVVRGQDLCKDLIGKLSFSDYFYLLLTGRRPTPEALAVLDATLVAIAEHGLVPSVQASRMTFAAAPDALQGAVAAGILGSGSVILGASETAGSLFNEVEAQTKAGLTLDDAALVVVRAWHEAKRAIAGYGHPLHKRRDPRVDSLFEVAREHGTDLRYVAIAEAVERAIPRVLSKDLKLNVSAAIPAVLMGIGFPLQALRGVPILARTAGLIAHLQEEIEKPIGFALSYQATRDVEYDGELPPGVTLKAT